MVGGELVPGRCLISEMWMLELAVEGFWPSPQRQKDSRSPGERQEEGIGSGQNDGRMKRKHCKTRDVALGITGAVFCES